MGNVLIGSLAYQQYIKSKQEKKEKIYKKKTEIVKIMKNKMNSFIIYSNSLI